MCNVDHSAVGATCAYNVQLVNLPSEVKTEVRFGVSVKFWSRKAKSQVPVTRVEDKSGMVQGASVLFAPSVAR